MKTLKDQLDAIISHARNEAEARARVGDVVYLFARHGVRAIPGKIVPGPRPYLDGWFFEVETQT